MPVSPRDIPAIDTLISRPDVSGLVTAWGRPAVLDALREAASEVRRELTASAVSTSATRPERGDWAPDAEGGGGDDLGARIASIAARRLASDLRPSLRRVVNATGVIVHTNLGRAPLSAAAIAHLAAVAGGYVNLEFDLEAGGRGRRDVHAEALLQRLTGAEAAVVVNNNAAATMLVLAALAAGREVLISRAELVEIGGGFRVPDIMRQSGAILREVGTTNRTRVADYAAAIGERTGLILRVHPSNFRIEGFTERPDEGALVALARRFDLPIVEDLGNGNVLGAALGVPGGEGVSAVEEPTVGGSLHAGHDVVCVSGDKLLGGPQAGLVLGRHDLVDRLRRHPLMRAFRVDKLTYAALEATLLEHLAGRAASTVPVAAMIALPRAAIAARAQALVTRLAGRAGLRARLTEGVSTIGGGSAPGSALPTVLVALERDGVSADAWLARLRAQAVPVIARIERDVVVIDLRTVGANEDEELAGLIAAAAAGNDAQVAAR